MRVPGAGATGERKQSSTRREAIERLFLRGRGGRAAGQVRAEGANAVLPACTWTGSFIVPAPRARSVPHRSHGFSRVFAYVSCSRAAFCCTISTTPMKSRSDDADAPRRVDGAARAAHHGPRARAHRRAQRRHLPVGRQTPRARRSASTSSRGSWSTCPTRSCTARERRPAERHRLARLHDRTSRTSSTTRRAIRTTRPTSSTCGSIAAVPIPYQRRRIGVLSVSARERDAFSRRAPRRARGARRLGREVPAPRAALPGDARARARPFLIKGLSPEWLEVERRIERVAATDAPVLVTGESGTGKELVAHAIHFNSRRAQAAVRHRQLRRHPRDAAREPALRPRARRVHRRHVRQDRRAAEGRRRHALPRRARRAADEPAAQALRALEQGEVQPLGSNKPPERVDVRLVCATNRDLPAHGARADASATISTTASA